VVQITDDYPSEARPQVCRVHHLNITAIARGQDLNFPPARRWQVLTLLQQRCGDLWVPPILLCPDGGPALA
jgi:hypothetical protein